MGLAKLAQRHVSPDKLMTFLVVEETGDITLGFEGQPWHTHGDILAELSGLPIEEAVLGYVDDLLSNRAVIAVATVNGQIRDIWIADDPDRPDPYKPDDEIITFRYWDGTLYRSH